MKILQVQSKVENQLARISRLRKFVISKSQNPKIASTLALTQMRFWTDFFDLKSDKFPPYDILSKTGNLLISLILSRINNSSFNLVVVGGDFC